MPSKALTTVGKGLIIAALIVGNIGAFMAHGTGTGDPAVGDTALGTAADLDAGKAWAVTSHLLSGTTIYRSIYTMACGSTETITEVGLFNLAVFGSTHLMYRETFTGLTVDSGDTILYTIDMTIA